MELDLPETSATAAAAAAMLALLLMMARPWGCGVKAVEGNFIIPGLSRDRYVVQGDINFGALLPFSNFAPDLLCSGDLRISSVRLPQALAYITDKVNKEGLLPPNTTLGFVVLDDCLQESATAATALAFVPQSSCHGNADFCQYINCSASGPEEKEEAVVPWYDVVAVLGSTYSSQTVAAARVLGPALVPLVSIFSTSDDLSSKAQFPYFLRTVPPDRFQFKAIYSLIRQYGWSYVSVVYQEGSYGENGFKNLRDLFSAGGICLAAIHRVPLAIGPALAETVSASLLQHRNNARAVVAIANVVMVQAVVGAVARAAPPGTLTWIASDAWAGRVEELRRHGDHLLDTLTVAPLKASHDQFEHHFDRLRPTNKSDPWFLRFYERIFNCSLNNDTCDTSRSISETTSTEYRPSSDVNHVFDVVYMIANATARILAAPECSGRSGSAARACVTGPKLLRELKATRQDGYTGWLELDVNGDRLGRYRIVQVVPNPARTGKTFYTYTDLAVFDSLTDEMLVVQNVSWVHYNATPERPHPRSRCSDPCGPQQARVVQEVTCCWLCHACRPNERLENNGSLCQACPSFTWPDSAAAHTVCRPISPDAPRYDSLLGGLVTVLASLCLLVCLAVAAFFHRHRHCRVIKASSRELSSLILLALGTGYVVVILLQAPPGEVTCRLTFLLFCLSFALLYGPLLVRALRIFRIFRSGKTSAQRPRYIESGHQLLFSTALVLVQVVMCAVTIAALPNWTRLTQSSDQERYVELSCEMPVAGLASFLAYTLLLEAACALLAFKTRHLPDNFNESKFIGLCVSATLVVLLCFIPAYVLASRQLLRMSMLALVLVLNHSVALVFLFLPKLYAVLYLQGAADVNLTAEARTGFVGADRGRGAVATGVTTVTAAGAGHSQAGRQSRGIDNSGYDSPPNIIQVQPS